jgi:endonuclease/exonuclease/phosphatase family metal-dependent hydrolase
MEARLRVAQLNLFHTGGDWRNRRDVLVAGLRQAAPDLVAFEESVVTGDYDQVRDLLGDGYHIQHQRHRTEDGVGVSLASRWPLLQTGEVDLSTVTPDVAAFAAVLLHARVEAPEPFGPLWFANCKPTWQRGAEHERELQAVRSAAALEELADDGHVVVAGDFDAVPDAASIRFWTGRQSLQGRSVFYRDAWEAVHGAAGGHTFTPDNALVVLGEMPLELGRRIDYILVRGTDHGPTLRIADCTLLFDAPVDGVWASDHFGVLADLVPHDPPRVVR